ncbi:MAG: hydrogenase maturation nickel metallochaperone HypA [Rudaea sp.]
MHELAVTENILRIAAKHAADAGAERVTRLYLVVGQLSSIVDESVQFYWDMISQGTIAQGARLHFRRVPIEIDCLDCGLRYSPGKDDLACPRCFSTNVRIVSGEEFYLDSIEVEGQAAGEVSTATA